jgi:hypothetical protein
MGYFVAISHPYTGFLDATLKALQIILIYDENLGLGSNLGANVKLRCIRTKENVLQLLLAINSIILYSK